MNREQAMNIINAGLRSRHVAGQAMNEESSRSHTLLHVDIVQVQKREGYPVKMRSRLVLADLAGSERVRNTTPTGVRLEEAKYINSSLSALGNVIAALANNSGKAQSQFIPYITSKLTRVLTNCLSYESKIVVMATLTPAKSCYFESVSTL
jgi:hypothetical protein